MPFAKNENLFKASQKKNPTPYTRSPAKTRGTCSIIFEFVVLIRGGIDNFKNLRIGRLPKL